MEKTDLAIIGGGPGGYVAALRASQLGMKVILIERDQLGGVCLNRGCIPTKCLLQTAAFMHQINRAAEFGVVFDGTEPRLDFGVALSRRDGVVSRLRKGVDGLVKRAGVQVLTGSAEFTGPQSLIVRSEEAGVSGNDVAGDVVEARNIIIATGSKPASLPVEGSALPRVLDSDGALALTSMPASVVIVGAGAVGCEWSQIFARLGARVTLVEMLPSVLPREDEDVSKVVSKALTQEGITIRTGCSITGIRDAGECLDVDIASAEKETVRAEYVLIGAGRAPLTDGLGLERAGVRVDAKKGWVTVDERQRTSVSSVLAIGDVTGQALLAHAASREGIVAVESLAGLAPDSLDADRVPAVTFTDPEVASVGLTESACRSRGMSVTSGKFRFAGNGRALAQAEEAGLVKVVAESRFGRILGVHMVGPHVGELIGEAVLALELEATLDEFSSIVRPHPTLSETLGEAALAAAGHPLH